MKTNLAATVTIIVMLIAICLSVRFGMIREHDPRDLSYWSQVGATQSWASAAAQGDPQAQFFYGFALIRTDLVTMIDRVQRLSDISVIGKRYFETVSYQLDSGIDKDRLNEAYRWIKLSGDRGFAPANEARKLFLGRIAVPNQGDPANQSQPIRADINKTSAAAGSGR